MNPMPPPPEQRPPVAVFAHTPAELSYIVVQRITSITVVAPPRISEDQEWLVRVTMGSDRVERHFTVAEYMPDTGDNVRRAFAMARDDAVVFARELNAHLNCLLKGEWRG